MILDGVIKDKNINRVKVIIDLIPKSNKFARPANKMLPKYITIHETGNKNKGANALAHTEYVDNVNKYVSWHFTVDEDYIIQELPINENAWHAGDGGEGVGNRKSIAIELCVNKDGDFNKVKENARVLIQFLMNETGIKEIYPHKHWSGKNCPKTILEDGWDKFINFVHIDFNKEYEIIKNERDYYKQKFKELSEWIKEVNEYGGY